MKVRSLAVGILFAGILSVPVFAQATAEPKSPGNHPRRARAEGAQGFHGHQTPDQQVERLNKELNLTADQKDKIQKLITDNQAQMRQEMRTFAMQNRDKVKEINQQIEEASKAGDKEKVKTLQAQRRELTGEAQMTAAREKLMSDIEGVLTPEQKPKFDQIKRDVFGGHNPLEENPKALMKAVQSLNLPAERQQKIQTLFDDAKAKASSDGKPTKADAADLYKKVLEELTPEEQAKVKAWHPSTLAGHDHAEGKAAKGQAKGHKGHKHNQDANAPGSGQ